MRLRSSISPDVTAFWGKIFGVRRKCPTCGRAITVEAPDTFRPFCSERCRTADLGKWLDGAYRIGSPVSEEDLDQSATPRDADDGEDDRFRPQ
jgi:endogenous inhibitor of DNA gyrase (YacG/DUF329 family)